jgi:hypothetical protein
MMKPNIARTEEARKKAREMFVQVQAKDAEAVREREKVQAAQTAKTNRLRALRLAKEEADKLAAPVPAPKPVKKVAVKAVPSADGAIPAAKPAKAPRAKSVGAKSAGAKSAKAGAKTAIKSVA